MLQRGAQAGNASRAAELFEHSHGVDPPCRSAASQLGESWAEQAAMLGERQQAVAVTASQQLQKMRQGTKPLTRAGSVERRQVRLAAARDRTQQITGYCERT